MQRNNLLNQYNQHTNNNSNRMFSQNAMINQNPNYSSKDTNFYNKIQMAKLEQIKRAKKIEDMGMTKKELYEHIIDPHKIEKTSKAEIDKDLNKINGMYAIEKTSQTNDFIRELWKKRTNNPYKNVIKKEQFESNYKKYQTTFGDPLLKNGISVYPQFDIKIDIINRPEKVILEKRIPLKSAIVAHIVLNSIAMLLAIFSANSADHPEWASLQIICIILLWFYSSHFKRQFIFGNIVVPALVALSIPRFPVA